MIASRELPDGRRLEVWPLFFGARLMLVESHPRGNYPNVADEW